MADFCSQTDLEKRYGERAVREWSDHDDDGQPDAGVIAQAIGFAEDEILLRIGQIYDRADLETSATITRWAVVMAGYHLSRSRGNPAPEPLAQDYVYVHGRLNETLDGWLRIPEIETNC